MEKKILLIGNGNSKWVMRYVKRMHAENRMVTLINDAQFELAEKKGFYDYYREHNVKVLTISDSNLYLRCLKCVALVNQMDDFDVCHIMFLTPYASLVAKMCERKFGIIVANFFGTDFYKSSGIIKQEQKMLLDVADLILAPVDKMEQEISKMYPEFQDKIHTVYFESQVLHILKTNQAVSGDISKVLKGLTEERIIIAAGYKGGSYQQHEMFIRALNRCDKKIREKVTVIFMMTYALTEEYETYIRNLLAHAGFDYIIIKEFLNDEEMALLRRRIDIFVNTVYTDAFNAAIQESLYCQTVVLCGSWLNYPSLDQEQAYIVKFADEEDLSRKLEETVENLPVLKEKSAVNASVIERIDSKRENIENWSSFYGYKRVNHQDKYNQDLNWYLLEQGGKLNDRNRLYKDVMELWLEAKMEQKSPLCTYIENRNWNRVVLYGAGSLGNMVYREIEALNISVIICDNYMDKADWYKGEILKPEELSDAMADGVIVTPVHFFNEIKQKLRATFDIDKIVSLMDILKG